MADLSEGVMPVRAVAIRTADAVHRQARRVPRGPRLRIVSPGARQRSVSAGEWIGLVAFMAWKAAMVYGGAVLWVHRLDLLRQEGGDVLFAVAAVLLGNGVLLHWRPVVTVAAKLWPGWRFMLRRLRSRHTPPLFRALAVPKSNRQKPDVG